MQMTENASGDRYYYERGCIRLLAKMDEQALRAIKTVAVQRDKSIMEVTKEALEEFLRNTEVLARDFMPEANGSSLKTFIPKELHKKVKIVATRDFGKRLGDLTGAVLSRWAKERSSEAWPTVETQKGSGAETLEKIEKLRAQEIPVASGPN
jgi:hypothetical protein